MSETLRTIFNMACPKCGNDTSLNVVISCWAELRPDGTDPVGDHEWNEESPCDCSACHHAGIVADFNLPVPTAVPKAFSVTFTESTTYEIQVLATDNAHALTLAKTTLTQCAQMTGSIRNQFHVEEVPV